MQCFVVVVVLISAAFSLAVPQGSTYTTKWDNVNIEEILTSDRLLKNYMNCVMDKGSCTPDASELKRLLPEAIDTDCSKCSERQKAGAEKVLRFLVKKKPEMYQDFAAKYDPMGIYKQRHPKIFEN